MKDLIYKNHKSANQTKEEFAVQLLDAIMKNKDGIVDFTVDDGDGDVWKYVLDVDVFRVEPDDNYLGDGKFADNH